MHYIIRNEKGWVFGKIKESGDILMGFYSPNDFLKLVQRTLIPSPSELEARPLHSRKIKGLTAAEWAERLGTDVRQMRNWLYTKRRPSNSTVLLAVFLYEEYGEMTKQNLVERSEDEA